MAHGQEEDDGHNIEASHGGCLSQCTLGKGSPDKDVQTQQFYHKDVFSLAILAKLTDYVNT